MTPDTRDPGDPRSSSKNADIATNKCCLQKVDSKTSKKPLWDLPGDHPGGAGPRRSQKTARGCQTAAQTQLNGFQALSLSLSLYIYMSNLSVNRPSGCYIIGGYRTYIWRNIRII